ncbi:hypothetical protein [Natrialba sp. SSL1]|uniref:hypothetical protein n=1 Tax=Natrialba sp. SSL1 TaxID=1869245 RepID=UPI000B0F9B5E|nr:hypothetical protein [Natrialba sp. SSL1]
MDESIGQQGAIAFLIERVAIPLLIVFGAVLLGAATTDVLIGRGDGRVPAGTAFRGHVLRPGAAVVLGRVPS